MTIHMTRRLRGILWVLMALAAISVLWIMQVEVTYRHNVKRLPTIYPIHRHLITRVWVA